MMKKYMLSNQIILFISCLVFGIDSHAASVTASGSPASGNGCGSDCSWTLYDDGSLVVTGTGSMYNYEAVETHAGYNPPPWGTSYTSVTVEGLSSIGAYAFSYAPNLTSVTLPDSVTVIGGAAFEHSKNIANIDLPPSVTTIGSWAFYDTKLTSIDLPETVSHIGASAFRETQIESIVLPEALFRNGTSGVDTDAFILSRVTTVYCPAGNTVCENTDFTHMGSSTLNYGTITPETAGYVKEDGLYRVTDENGVATGPYYLSASDVATDNPCTDVNACKAEVLQNKGLCQDKNSDCAALVAAADNHQLLKVGSKTYQSLDALLKGDYDRRRIYTIEEANLVAGDRNTVTIRYR